MLDYLQALQGGRQFLGRVVVVALGTDADAGATPVRFIVQLKWSGS